MKQPSAETPGCDVIFEFIEQAPKPELASSNDPAAPAKSIGESVGISTFVEFIEQANRSPAPPEP